MAINRGVAPLDADSDVGKVRLTISDVSYVPLDPPESGYGSFQMFGDDELAQFLESSEDSILGAAGYAYLSLAGQAALAAKAISDHDLRIDTTKRADSLRLQAQWFLDQAGLSGPPDYFAIVPTGRAYTRDELAEIALVDTAELLF